jgi:hypothetical protein
MIKRPKPGEYAPFHENYLKYVPPRVSARGLLKSTLAETVRLLSAVPEERGDFAYEPGKWTLKQVMLHTIDTERVFAFRTLSFMRGDRVALPGFNQDVWMEQADVSRRTIKDLLKEWKTVRENTLYLLDQCTESQSRFLGTASGWKVSPRAYFFVIAGHHLHHLGVIRERYLL